MAQFTPEWQANFPLTDPSRLLVKVGPVYSGITGPVWSGMGGPICSGIASKHDVLKRTGLHQGCLHDMFG